MHSAEDVVGDGFGGISFHQRDVLVGGGMEDDVRAMGAEDGLDALGEADIGDNGGDPDPVPPAAPQQIFIDVKDRVFAMADEDQLGGAVAEELAAELAADGAAAACDEDAPAAHQLLDGGDVGADGIAAQEVFDIDVAQLVNADRAVEQLVDAGDDLGPDAGGFTDVDDLADLLAGRGRHGDDHHADVVAAGHVGDGLAVAEDGDAVDEDVALAGIVVDIAGDVEAKLGVILQLAHDHRAGIAGAHDGDALARPVVRRPGLQAAISRTADHAHGQARGGGDRQRQQEGDHRRRAGNDVIHLRQGNDDPAGDVGRDSRGADGDGEQRQLVGRGITPVARVDAAVAKDDRGDEDDGAGKDEAAWPEDAEIKTLQTQDKAEVNGRRQQEQVEHEEVAVAYMR